LKKAVDAPGADGNLMANAMLATASTGDISLLRRHLPAVEKAIAARQPKSPPPVVFVGHAYLLAADGKTDEAIATLQSNLSDDPRQANNYYSMGRIQEQGGRIDDAIASYKHVVDVAPAMGANFTVAVTRLALARVLSNKGDTAGAKVQIDILQKQWAHADAGFLPAQELKKLNK
jgi:tetratricopeptide (TPR) repeat protein